MTNTSITISDLREAINNVTARSAWMRGVKVYANELLDELCEIVSYAPEAMDNVNLLQRALLNGASSWAEYSEGGCSLICDLDIAFRLCNATELKRTRNGERNPNARESWIDVQARALTQACWLILDAYKQEVA